jgi:hypothetical protein
MVNCTTSKPITSYNTTPTPKRTITKGAKYNPPTKSTLLVTCPADFEAVGPALVDKELDVVFAVEVEAVFPDPSLAVVCVSTTEPVSAAPCPVNVEVAAPVGALPYPG